MTPDPRLQQVEDACAQLLAHGEHITFDEVAARTGLGRATLYRNPELRATVEEHRTRGHEAQTFTDLAAQIAHLRTALDAVAANVRRHEEELRKLRRSERRA
jgi:AcrR family transcriptional regulator